jgi:hypothetical protein
VLTRGVGAEALEPHPLADVAVGQEHALAVTQQVSCVCFSLTAVPTRSVGVEALEPHPLADVAVGQ